MKEIEFVCYNTQFENATPLKNQKKLCRDLMAKKKKLNILPYRQNFSIGREKQISMSVILLGDEDDAREFIGQRADRHGVEIDTENEVTEDFVRRVRNRELEGQTGCD